MHLFLEQLLNGIATGSIYALVTLGLALVYGILRILHVAHAAVPAGPVPPTAGAPRPTRRWCSSIVRPASTSPSSATATSAGR